LLAIRAASSCSHLGPLVLGCAAPSISPIQHGDEPRPQTVSGGFYRPPQLQQSTFSRMRRRRYQCAIFTTTVLGVQPTTTQL